MDHRPPLFYCLLVSVLYRSVIFQVTTVEWRSCVFGDASASSLVLLDQHSSLFLRFLPSFSLLKGFSFLNIATFSLPRIKVLRREDVSDNWPGWSSVHIVTRLLVMRLALARKLEYQITVIPKMSHYSYRILNNTIEGSCFTSTCCHTLTQPLFLFFTGLCSECGVPPDRGLTDAHQLHAHLHAERQRIAESNNFPYRHRDNTHSI